MKKILITGEGSYIGTSFENWLKQWPEQYGVYTVGTMHDEWKAFSFVGYDAVFHVSGIVHVKETKENADLYYKVNRDLAVEIAKKVKSEGVKQFILMSTMAVYGMETGIITRETKPNPKSHYAKSKLQAEEQIGALSDGRFKVARLRPPMIYGKGCKGNFQTFISIVKKYPFFPKVNNQRSMLYIDNLCEFLKLIIDKEAGGLYYPQNKEYVCTSEMASLIAQSIGKRVHMSAVAGYGVAILRLFVTEVRKGFGSLIYVDTEDWNYSYCGLNFKDSIERCLKAHKKCAI